MNLPLLPSSAQMPERIALKTIDYLTVPSVVGCEQHFMGFLEDDFTALGLHVDRAGGYMAVSGADPLSAMICAHVDRHGLLSLGNDEYVYAAQYLKGIKYGEDNRLAPRQLENIARRFEDEAVFAYDPETGKELGQGIIHACDDSMADGDAVFSIDNMPRQDANTPLAYTNLATFDGRYLKGQIDNAVSIAVVYYLFKQGFQGTAILAAEEEIGKSWGHIKSYLERHCIKTKKLIVLDTSPYADNSVIDDGAIVLRKRDASGLFNGPLVDELIARAKDLSLPYEVKDQVMLSMGRDVDQLGLTELGRLIESTDGEWNGATVQVPTLMYHTNNETTTAKALDHYFAFLKDILIDGSLTDLRAKQEK